MKSIKRRPKIQVKSILSYFTDNGEIIWFQGHQNLNRNVITQVKSSQWGKSIPRWFTYYEKMHSSDTFIHDSTAASPLALLLLASNIRFNLHKDAYDDETLDAATKRRLDVLFPNPEARIYNVLVSTR